MQREIDAADAEDHPDEQARAAARLRATGRAYVDFAIAEPGLFDMAFSAIPDEDGLDADTDPYDLLTQVLDDGVAGRCRLRRPPTRRRGDLLGGRARVRDPARPRTPGLGTGRGTQRHARGHARPHRARPGLTVRNRPGPAFRGTPPSPPTAPARPRSCGRGRTPWPTARGRSRRGRTWSGATNPTAIAATWTAQPSQ